MKTETSDIQIRRAVEEFVGEYSPLERRSAEILSPIGIESEWRISPRHSQFSFSAAYSRSIAGAMPTDRLLAITDEVKSLEMLDIGQDVDGDAEVALRPTAGWQAQVYPFEMLMEMGLMPSEYLYTLHVNIGTKRSLSYVRNREVNREILFPLAFLYIPDARWKSIFFEYPHKFKFEGTEDGYSRWHIQMFVIDPKNWEGFRGTLRLMQYLLTAREYALARQMGEPLNNRQISLAGLYTEYRNRLEKILPQVSEPLFGTNLLLDPANTHEYFLLRNRPEWQTLEARRGSDFGAQMEELLRNFAESVETVVYSKTLSKTAGLEEGGAMTRREFLRTVTGAAVGVATPSLATGRSEAKPVANPPIARRFQGEVVVEDLAVGQPASPQPLQLEIAAHETLLGSIRGNFRGILIRPVSANPEQAKANLKDFTAQEQIYRMAMLDRMLLEPDQVAQILPDQHAPTFLIYGAEANLLTPAVAAAILKLQLPASGLFLLRLRQDDLGQTRLTVYA